MFPKWGTLLTYGKALVIKILRLPLMGSIFVSDAILSVATIFRSVQRVLYGEEYTCMSHCMSQVESALYALNSWHPAVIR